MPPRLLILQSLTRQLHSLLPTIRVTRTRTLAMLVLGLLWAGTVRLPLIASVVPVAATDASLERRLRRWLANAAVDVQAIWAQLMPVLLASRAGQEVTLLFDPTPQNDRFTVLLLGLVAHGRILPLAWRVVPQQDGPWDERQTTYQAALMRRAAAALPPACTVTLLGDRGITGVAVMDVCAELGWHYVLRLNAGAHRHVQWRSSAGAPEQRVWDVVTGPGQRWAGSGQVFKAAGWRDVALTIRWDREANAPWILISDRAGGPDRVREYRRRARGEATYEDCKRRGFDLERSKVVDLARFDRLLLAVHLAFWWGMQLGLRTLRHGQRRRYDRTDRRDLSVLRIGRAFLLDADMHQRCPPLPFHQRHGAWSYTWLA